MPFVDDVVASIPEMMEAAGLADGSDQPEGLTVDFDGMCIY